MSKKDIYINSEDELIKDREQREITFNGLTANEWAIASRSVWKDLPFPRSESKIIDEDVISEEVYAKILLMYSKENDYVLDPFMGRGNSIIASIHNNRHGIGFESNKQKFDDANDAILNSLNLLVNCDYRIFNSSFVDGKNQIDDDSIQLAVSSLIYKINENEESYDSFLNKIDDTLNAMYCKIKEAGYVVFIVRDFRDIKNNLPYVECHNDVARIAMKNGFTYHDVIIYDHNGQRGLLLQGYPKVFYVNLNHSYVIILRKNKI